MSGEIRREREPARPARRDLVTPDWLAALAALALVVVSGAALWQANVSARTQSALVAAQNEILAAAHRPAFVIHESLAGDSTTGTYDRLTITNEGAPVEAFRVRVETYLQLGCLEDVPGFTPAVLRIEHYYSVGGDASGGGVLYVSDTSVSERNRTMLQDFLTALQTELQLGEKRLYGLRRTYLVISYTDSLGVEQALAYVVPEGHPPRRLSVSELDVVHDALTWSNEDSRCTISCLAPPTGPEAAVMYVEAVTAHPYDALPQ